ncbi:mitogen-activated protein kinase kinase kinase 3-like [Benincasa hispida]|uniref:mitogen-activated protein kinase kinase kinase 3-like n=1 Tax=Benincasa hispida TaxID=102211 RepID=UPI00190193A2|nr:mitogen-activated protein kinase kinase kinase 3-like [Benincasa hispida]
MSNWNQVKVLGKGSHGTVFLAGPTSAPLDFVALKVVLVEYVYSLMIEETILLNFNGCPEIIQRVGSGICFEGDSLDTVTYNLTLEYDAGGSLIDLIRRREKFPEVEVKEYLKMILRGLCCIHERGYVHGDIKVDNILVFPDDTGKVKLKIANFGLSKKCDEFEEVAISTNAKPRFRGTPKYISPESILFGKINTSLDIWSLGCVLIEMIYGKPEWSDCKTLGQLVKKIVNQMDLPADIPEELSREGRDFLSKCIDQKSEQRWTANMLLKHPYLKEEYKVDELFSTQSLPDLSDIEWFEERGFL